MNGCSHSCWSHPHPRPSKTTTTLSGSRFIQAAFTKHPSERGMALTLTNTL